MIVILEGRPGSGKEAVTKAMVLLGFHPWSPGEIFRGEYPAGSKMHELVKPCLSFVKQGHLVPNYLFLPVWHEYVSSLASVDDVIMDGFPRNEWQAKLVVDSANVIAKGTKIYVVRLIVSRQECIKRMKNRGRHDDIFCERRHDLYEKECGSTLRKLQSSPQVIVTNAVVAEHFNVSKEESMAVVVKEVCDRLGLYMPPVQPPRSLSLV